MLKLVDRLLGDLLLSILGVFKSKKRTCPSPIKKILVIKLIAMGDLIVITPLVRTLRQAYPEATIDLLAAPRVRPIVENMRLYHRVHYLSFGFDFLWSVFLNIFKLHREHYDMVIDLEFYYRLTTILATLIRPKYLLGLDLQPTRTHIFDLAVAYDENIHVADAYLNIAKAIDISELDKNLEPLHIKESDKQSALQRFPSKDFFLVHIGTSARAVSRRWTFDQWSSLISRLSETNTVVLIGGDEETDIARSILLPRHNVTNLIGQLTLTQTAALMEGARLYIGLDTGPTHLAAAMGTPVVALYGPNTPVRWGPYSSKARVLYKPNSCSPCTRQYEGVVSTCRDNQCMKAIRVDEVLEAVDSLLL